MQRALLLLALHVHTCAGQYCAPPCSPAPDAPDVSRGFSQRHTGTGTAALALASGRRHRHKLHPQASGTRAESRPLESDDSTRAPSSNTDALSEGVVWAVVGAEMYWNELAQSVRAVNVLHASTVFTTNASLATCEAIVATVACVSAEQASLELASRSQHSQTVATARHKLKAFWERFLTRGGSTLDKTTTRMLKITAFMAAPYRLSLFLDTDAIACHSQPQLFHLAGRAFLRTYDFAMAINHDGSTYVRNSSWRAAFEVPLAFPELNSGVVFLQPNKSGVQTVLSLWLSVYNDRTYVATSSKGRGTRGPQKGVGDQQALTIALWMGIKQRLVQLGMLTSPWNFNHFRNDFKHPPADNCCDKAKTKRITLVIDHKCKSTNVSHAFTATASRTRGASALSSVDVR